MTIHVVKQGETIEQIASQYHVSPKRILQDNMLINGEPLVEGQTIIILFPRVSYIVKDGDSLESIASQYNLSVSDILQYNSWLSENTALFPGLEIVINYKGDKIGKIHTNGYVFPSIHEDIFSAILPFLTYITIYTYGFTKDGELIAIDDEKLIKDALKNGVAPIMSISSLTSDGTFSSELTHEVINNHRVQDIFIDKIIMNLSKKGYRGLDIDFEYILPEDRLPFVELIQNVTTRLHQEGFLVRISLAPKTSALQSGILYEAHDYYRIGMIVDQVIIMLNDWGFTYSPPMAVSPMDKVREVVNYAITDLDHDKIILGLPNYGYEFVRPYIKGTSKAKVLDYMQAMDKAKITNSIIRFDELSEAPYFTYTGYDKAEHEVWFQDARSMVAMLQLIPRYGLNGLSYWTVMNYNPQNWLLISTLFDIAKIM